MFSPFFLRKYTILSFNSLTKLLLNVERKQILLQLSACQIIIFIAIPGRVMEMKVIISLKIFINFKSCFEELVLQILLIIKLRISSDEGAHKIFKSTTVDNEFNRFGKNLFTKVCDSTYSI
jgi:hypothetical protein